MAVTAENRTVAKVLEELTVIRPKQSNTVNNMNLEVFWQARCRWSFIGGKIICATSTVKSVFALSWDIEECGVNLNITRIKCLSQHVGIGF